MLGTDIFFRNGAYRPETEEGRKILAHELTHVAQDKKREEYRGASRELSDRFCLKVRIAEDIRVVEDPLAGGLSLSQTEDADKESLWDSEKD